MIDETMKILQVRLTTHNATLIAVSKNQPDDKIDAALQAGLRQFGENRVQEAQKHWQSRRPLYPDLTLHLIGPLQSNKAADAVALFDVIHTIDREKIARTVHAEITRQKKNIPCFIQINTGAEPQKSGVALQDAQAFLTLCRDDIGLEIIGLMCIPPVNEDPAAHFALLQNMARDYKLPCLSMGMSDDYETALKYGATHVRIGSALFGDRL